MKVLLSGRRIFAGFLYWWRMDPGGVPLKHLSPDLEAFKKLIASCGKRNGGVSQKNVKKVDIPSVELPAKRTCRSALNLA